MFRTVLIVLLALIANGGLVSASTTLQALTRSVFVNVSDSKGALVTDLTAADVTVKDDGKAREVVNVERATGPITVALLIDDNGLGANDVRAGAVAFVQRLRGRAEIALVTTAGQNVTRVDYTTNIDAHIDAIRQLYVRPAPPGGHLLEAVMDAARSLEARKAQRPAIVILAFESEEFSTLRQDRVLDQLRRSGASLNVIMVGRAKTSPSMTQDENMNRNKVLGDGPKQSGGRHEEMIVTAGVPNAMLRIASDLTNQYVVSYSLPAGVKPSGRIAVSVTRRGVTLRAPTRVPDR
jgi:VWFA-related protein